MFETRYVNEYGEPWVFRNEPETAAGTVEERDVDGETYPVLRGFSDSDLILSGEETLWLWRSWREAVGRYGDPGIYGVAQSRLGRTARRKSGHPPAGRLARARISFPGVGVPRQAAMRGRKRTGGVRPGRAASGGAHLYALRPYVVVGHRRPSEAE